jgi:hypothetical protein
MFGYRKIKWDRPNKNTWVSPDGLYVIDRQDAINYIAQKKVFNTEVGCLIYDDHIVATRLNGAKKWCDELCEKDYLHNLQVHINQTSRYGS